jgi:hypothetical protein
MPPLEAEAIEHEHDDEHDSPTSESGLIWPKAERERSPRCRGRERFKVSAQEEVHLCLLRNGQQFLRH